METLYRPCPEQRGQFLGKPFAVFGPYLLFGTERPRLFASLALVRRKDGAAAGGIDAPEHLLLLLRHVLQLPVLQFCQLVNILDIQRGHGKVAIRGLLHHVQVVVGKHVILGLVVVDVRVFPVVFLDKLLAPGCLAFQGKYQVARVEQGDIIHYAVNHLGAPKPELTLRIVETILFPVLVRVD